MAPDYSVFVLGTRISTVEALYQACRFPDDPEVQKIIVDQMSPMTAKMKCKKYRDRTREDWDDVRVNIMRWCLRIKLENNWERFGHVLERTGDRPIVEESTKDVFWGAKPSDDGLLVGMHVLGRLSMELKEQFHDIKRGRLSGVQYPVISHFLLFGKPLEPSVRCSEVAAEIQHSMFE